MLDHAKCAYALHKIADQLFADFSHETAMIRQTWERIAADATFAHKVRAVDAPWPVPTWDGPLDGAITVTPQKNPYYALSVDGSQIYPDRHHNVSCYLINIGSVVVPYELPAKVELTSVPYVFHGRENAFEQMTPTDLVNAKRQELELRAGLDLAMRIKKQAPSDIPTVLLFDGSLIFWHLAVHEQTVQRMLLAQYLAIIEQLHKEQVVCAWYISMPKSKELINLVRLFLCDFIPARKELYEITNRFVDSTIVRFFLKPMQRSIIFKNNAAVSTQYPDRLRPYFFYMHVGDEVGRVEIPAWVAQDTRLTDCVAQVVLDQCGKGQGYPVVLAEAHEQAVVKGPDRELFYHLIHKIGLQFNRRPVLSKKSFKKRVASI